MIEKILIANRGEIAVRIIRACREMGIETVAVYSEADKEALHTQLADEAVCIGPAQASESYLNMQNLISAALVSGADAIHPGFGFLSENAKFAELCEQCEITFIGPDSKVIGKMGNKTEARATMIAAGIPVIRGTNGAVLDLEEGKKEAARIGYPVIIKAALGGGGKGMRTAQSEEEFESCFVTARKEAEKAFGDGTMYIEHFVEHPRHIEFQILADSYGNIVHLGERDCSIQRNHQKMIEECPCAALSDELRKKMGETAVKAARAAVTRIPICAVTPSTVTLPLSIRRSASLLEQTPASLKYLFSLTDSFACKNSSLIRLLTSKHSTYIIVCKKCISAIQDQRICYAVCVHNILHRSAVISWINNNDLSVMRS